VNLLFLDDVGWGSDEGPGWVPWISDLWKFHTAFGVFWNDSYDEEYYVPCDGQKSGPGVVDSRVMFGSQ
jgi:hypothetical protein